MLRNVLQMAICLIASANNLSVDLFDPFICTFSGILLLRKCIYFVQMNIHFSDKRSGHSPYFSNSRVQCQFWRGNAVDLIYKAHTNKKSV